MNDREDGSPSRLKFVLILFLIVVFFCSIFLPLNKQAKASSQQFTQSNWVGGNNQTPYTDTTKFLNSTQVINTAPNQLTLNPQNLGTGAVGNCVVNTTVILNAETNNSCSGRSSADSASFPVNTLNSAGSTTITASQVTFFKSNQISSSTSGYNDSQKTIVIGQDGFARTVNFDHNYSAIVFTQCQNFECSLKTQTTVFDDPNGVDAPTIAMGSDGFARISYFNYASPSEFHYVRCTNASCSSNVNTLVASITPGNYTYSNSIAVGPDGFARITYDEYGSSVFGTLHLITCSNLDCTTKTNSIVATGTVNYDYFEAQQVEIASDNTARIASNYVGTLKKLYYISCNNITCTSPVSTELLTTNTYSSVSLAITSANLGRVIVQGGGIGLKLVNCTNDLCTTNNIENLDTATSSSTAVIRIGSDNLSRIVSSTSTALNYYTCNDLNCTSYATRTLVTGTSFEGYPASLAIDSNNKPFIFYGSNTNPYPFSLATDFFSPAASTGIFPGDEVLIINLKGTSSDFSNVGKYETHYVTAVSGNTLTLDSPLLNTYDGTTQIILVQRIPQYQNVTIQNTNLPTSTGLVGHWKLDETSGTSAIDSSGNGNTGTLSGSGSTRWNSGKLGGAGEFNGTNDYINVGHANSIKQFTAITIAAWIKPTQLNGNQYGAIVSDTNIPPKFAFDGEWSQKKGRVQLGGAYDCSSTDWDYISNSSWIHVAFTYDSVSNQVKCYQNGVLVGSTTGPGTTITADTSDIFIGALPSQSSFFKGNIDDVRIYNRALSSTEMGAFGSYPSLKMASNSFSGIIFFRATGTVTLDAGSTIDATGLGYSGGTPGKAGNGGTGGATYNGVGGSGGSVNGGNGSSGQGGGGGGAGGASVAGSGAAGGIGGGGGGGGGKFDCGNGGGGGGGGYATVGTAGGYRAASNGTSGSGSTGGNGGTGGLNATCADGGGSGGGGTFGTSNLSQLYYGSGGGGAGESGNGKAGIGGNGGGIIYISANGITTLGNITADGAHGGNAESYGSGGGGGAGGSIVLKANNISIGTSLVTSKGGNRGLVYNFGGVASDNQFGGTGGVGRIALYSPNAITGTTSPSYGTASPIGYSNSGILTSSIYDSAQSSDWGILNYTSNLPENTYSFVKVRTSNDAAMTGATDFSLCAAIGGGNDVSANSCVHDGDRYVQYQVLLATNDLSVTPTFTNFTLNYTLYIPPTPSPTATPVVTSTPTSTPIYIAQNSPTPTDTPTDTPTPEITTTVEPTTEPGVIPFIKLKILDPNGNPIKNTLVKLKSGSTELSGKTDNNGIVEFKNVKVGDYKVTYTYNGSEYTQDLKVENKDINNTKDVTTPKDYQATNPWSMWQYICCGIVLLLILGIIGFLITRRKDKEK